MKGCGLNPNANVTVEFEMPQTKQVVVQKFGGSSLATEELLRKVAKRVAARREQGADLVVCVSAMGDTTDELLNLAHRLSGDYSPNPRETDALISTGELVSASLMGIAIRGLGHDAISLSGRQAGIQTDETFGSARIANIEPARVLREIQRGRIVVIAGFQGLTPADDTTTLGRGASDLTAVAMAASIKADVCEIYTDVDGILTADPRFVPDARVIPQIGYEEMLEMASLGAKMNPRSIEMASVHKVPMLITSSFNPHAAGTKIGNFEDQNSNMEIRKSITSIATERSVARVTLHGIADRPGIAAAIMMPLAEAGISIDVIVQNVSSHGLTDMSFTVGQEYLQRVAEITSQNTEVGYSDIATRDGLAKVSVVGTGMTNSPGYAARMFRALADANVNIEMITTSEIRITCIVDQKHVATAARALHSEFELEAD